MFLPIWIDETGRNQEKSINETSVSSICTDWQIQSISIKSDLPIFMIYWLTNRYRFLLIDYSGINFSFGLWKVIRCSWGKQITEISWGEIIDGFYIKLAFCLALPTDKIIVPTKRVKKKSGTRIIATVDLVITLIARFWSFWSFSLSCWVKPSHTALQ